MNILPNINSFGIILDGSDQQGKTIFAQKLAIILNKKYIHYDKPDMLVDYYYEYTRFLKPYERYIFDRNYLSEIVYGNLFRKQSGVTKEIQEKIEKEYNKQNYIFVLCNRKDFSITSIEDREELYTKKQIILVKDTFLKYYETVSLPKIIVDPFENNKAIIEVINKCIEVSYNE